MVISTCVKIQNFHMVLSALMISAASQSISLTPAGEHFYRKSIIIRSDLEQLILETKRLDADDSYTLRLGCYKGYHGGEFSEAIARFSEKYPKVNVQVTIGSHDNLYHAMENGTIDLALNDQRRAFWSSTPTDGRRSRHTTRRSLVCTVITGLRILCKKRG